MRILPPALDLSLAGFSSHDLFGRKALADGLTNLLTLSDDPLVLAVDGQWGAGKTTFLSMWADQLKAAGFPVIRFDAFEHDYVEDPFMALAGEVIALAEQLAPKKDAITDLVARSVAASAVLVKHGVAATLKVATLGGLDALKVADEVGQAVAEAAKSASEEYLEAALTSQQAQKDTLRAFRAALSNLPGLISSPLSGDEHRPLIFIIDELDRCRPIFALQTLERIKHFFAVPNVHFVLGVNIEQLKTSVAAAYGSGVDASAYLQKFIHLTFQLSTGEDRGRRKTEAFVNYLTEEMKFPPQLRGGTQASCEILIEYACNNNLSLRTIERIISHMAIAYAFAAPDRWRRPQFFPYSAS